MDGPFLLPIIKELADLILKLSKEDQQILRMRGENGKLYSELNYNFTKCIDKLEKNVDAK